jgi:flagellar motor switch protein FliM
MAEGGDIRDLLLDAANISVDQLPMLPVIFDRFSTNLAERFRHLAWTPPHLTPSGIISTRIGEALDPYEMQAVAGIFHVPAWDNRVIVGFDRDFVFTMIELMFGGDGSEPPIEDMRNFSNLELQVTQALFEHVGAALQVAFSQVAQARFRFERAETRMDFAGVGRRNNPSVCAKFLLQAINRGGEMFVIVPQAALSPMRQALSKIVQNEASSPDPRWVKQFSEEVQRAAVSIKAVIESREYTLGDLAGLKVGDVLRLPATPQSRVKVESAEQPLFLAYLGQDQGYHTLCIDESIDPDQEFMNDVLAR